jgi:tetratricopeptide (TPR) repeat protein
VNAPYAPSAGQTSSSPSKKLFASRAALVALVGASLVGASLVRQKQVDSMLARQDAKAVSSSSGQSLDQLDGYTLGLLLGGLRGPLVMALWSTSEDQKSQRNLEDIDTKIEMIRLLQPEFDTVHLFQIWNKAYNLSVQMANLPGKYSTILDALDYAFNVRKTRPENINIEATIASVMFDKLGNSAEKAYYQARIREDSLPPEPTLRIELPTAQKQAYTNAAAAVGIDESRFVLRPLAGGQRAIVELRKSQGTAALAEFKRRGLVIDPAKDVTEVPPVQQARTTTSSKRTAFDSILVAAKDDKGNIAFQIKPEYAVRDVPAGVDDIDWRPDLGDLRYLVRFEPYPYGVSPFALAYNYYKRSVSLQVSRNQVHAQMSDRVISSRAPLSLRFWADEELERARRGEALQFGLKMDGFEEVYNRNSAGARLPLKPVAKTALVEQVLYNYARAAQLYDAATAEFQDHMKRYFDDAANYRNFITWQQAGAALARADELYLRAIVEPDPIIRKGILREARTRYIEGWDRAARHALAYYVRAEDTRNPAYFPVGETPQSIFTARGLRPEDLRRMLQAYQKRAEMDPGAYSLTDVVEYMSYVDRAAIRVETIDAALAPPAAQPK